MRNRKSILLKRKSLSNSAFLDLTMEKVLSYTCFLVNLWFTAFYSTLNPGPSILPQLSTAPINISFFLLSISSRLVMSSLLYSYQVNWCNQPLQPGHVPYSSLVEKEGTKINGLELEWNERKRLRGTNQEIRIISFSILILPLLYFLLFSFHHHIHIQSISWNGTKENIS